MFLDVRVLKDRLKGMTEQRDRWKETAVVWHTEKEKLEQRLEECRKRNSDLVRGFEKNET